MRWQSGRRSTNVEDRRGMRRGGVFKGGLVGILLTLLAAWVLGVNPLTLLQVQQQILPSSETADPNWKPSPAEEQMAEFTKSVLASTEDTWKAVFAENGKNYKDPALVMYTGSVQSGCGASSSQMGPFYCPTDQKVYIDLSFYDDLRTKMGAGGDFAQAYVIAHEVGHHVQTLLGISKQVRQAGRGKSKANVNALSVRQELQADCFAGIWGGRNRDILEEGDMQEAMNAASAIGDDRLQRNSTGRVSPESFTHGTSEQRMRWFSTGFRAGKISACDTFSAASL